MHTGGRIQNKTKGLIGFSLSFFFFFKKTKLKHQFNYVLNLVSLESKKKKKIS